MAINWDKIQKTIDDYLRAGAKDGNSSRTPDDTADFIATTYYNEIMANAKEMYQNGVSSINKEPLKQSLLNAFKSDFGAQTGGANTLNSAGALGEVQVWSGGTMQTLLPMVPGIVPVSNQVTSPGSHFPMNVSNSDATSNVPLAIEIVKSLSGINLWLDIKINPIPGPWSGIS